jgi:hypothetical protein
MVASFVLPLKHEAADYYFESTKDKIVRWGKNCQLKCIKDFLATTTHTLQNDKREDIKTYQPVNIKASNVTTEMKEAMVEISNSPTLVARAMKEQVVKSVDIINTAYIDMIHRSSISHKKCI